MGLDARDYDNDGGIDLWMTIFSLEANCFLVNDGTGYLGDLSFDPGLANLRSICSVVERCSWTMTIMDDPI